MSEIPDNRTDKRRGIIYGWILLSWRAPRLSISARVSEQVKTIISSLLNTECVESDPRPRRKYRVGRRLRCYSPRSSRIDDRALYLNNLLLTTRTRASASDRLLYLALLISQSAAVIPDWTETNFARRKYRGRSSPTWFEWPSATSADVFRSREHSKRGSAECCNYEPIMAERESRESPAIVALFARSRTWERGNRDVNFAARIPQITWNNFARDFFVRKIDLKCD